MNTTIYNECPGCKSKVVSLSSTGKPRFECGSWMLEITGEFEQTFDCLKQKSKIVEYQIERLQNVVIQFEEVLKERNETINTLHDIIKRYVLFEKGVTNEK